MAQGGVWERPPHHLGVGLWQGRIHRGTWLAKWPQPQLHVGVDIKGHRFWRGAKTANQESLSNVAFLRTRIEFIDQFFGPGEVELTFG